MPYSTKCRSPAQRAPITALPVLEEVDSRLSGLDITAKLRSRTVDNPIEGKLEKFVAVNLAQLPQIATIDIR